MTAEGFFAVALVALVPVVALMLSAFVKISVVLALLRNAIGTPDAPSALVVTGLSLIFTGFVMAPVAEKVVAAMDPAAMEWGERASGEARGIRERAERTAGEGRDAGEAEPRRGPFEIAVRMAAGEGGAAAWLAGERASVPVREFLARHASADDRAAFLQLARELRGAGVSDDDLLVLSAAFVTSELTEAFAIGFLVFLPFVVIELVVGLALGALGLAATPSSTIALPLKLLLFVAVDGWQLLLGGLVRGYL